MRPLGERNVTTPTTVLDPTTSTGVSPIPVSCDFNALARRVLGGERLGGDDVRPILDSSDGELLGLLQAAYRIRERSFGRRVKLHVLRNAKSGVCPEDCKFCSQSLHHNSEVEQYGMQNAESLLAGAERAAAMGATTYCMVTSTRGPTTRDLRIVCEAVQQIKTRFPRLRLCTSLGLLNAEQAAQLAAAGVDRYNHNLETSPRYFGEIASTHAFSDRVATVKAAKAAGMEACCGGILGMGESKEDWLALALALREIGVESIPLNFLDPRPGTPLGKNTRMAPNDCLRALALFRFLHPKAELRVAGGREVTLGSLQPLALYPANSIFLNGYLTTGGAIPSADLKMLKEAGFEPEIVDGGQKPALVKSEQSQ